MKIVTGNQKQNTRHIILQALKSNVPSTVESLAKTAQVSPVTVRHHLNSLTSEGLLTATSVRRKVGRPHYVYSLTEAGHELFPKKYARLSSRLIEELKSHFSSNVVTELFANVVSRIVDEHRVEFENLDFEGRLDYVVQLLADEGFLAQWEELDDGAYRLTESSCPYISVGQTHNEICTFDKGLITAILDVDVEQHSCILEGNSCCEFTFAQPELIRLN